jgi:hypothetical protein
MNKVKKPRNADHVRRKNVPTPSDEVIEARLQSLLEPAILGQQGYARLLGLRERILSFPVMVAAVLRLLWRQGSSRQGCGSSGVKVPMPSIARFRRRAYPLHGEVTNRDRRGRRSHGCPVPSGAAVGAILAWRATLRA